MKFFEESLLTQSFYKQLETALQANTLPAFLLYTKRMLSQPCVPVFPDVLWYWPEKRAKGHV